MHQTVHADVNIGESCPESLGALTLTITHAEVNIELKVWFSSYLFLGGALVNSRSLTLILFLLLGNCLIDSDFANAEGSSRSEAVETPWAFRQPQDTSLPIVQSGEAASTEIVDGIDAFILAKLQEHGLSWAEEASREKLIRRLSFDLIGLPPTPEELQAFVDDKESDAYAKVVDRLLADNRYGERWTRQWLDLARYADTAGYEGDPDLPHAWRYRDYVIDAFNSDKPYDQFIIEQIAGDEIEEIMGAGDLPGVDPEHQVALTFLRLAPFTEPRGDETRHEMLSEITSTVGSVFLGLTVGCAKCHDHKYDQIPTKDFYRLKAFFSTLQIPRPEPGDVYQIGGPISASFYRDGESEWAEQQRENFEKELKLANEELEQLRKEFAKHAESDEKEEIQKVIDNPELVTDQQRDRYEYLRNRERFINRQMMRLEPVAMSLRHSYGPPYEPSVPTSRVMIRGEYDNPGEVVEAGFLSCITGNQDPAPIRLDPFKRWPTRSRRMALAKWIASPENPLTARVMVNRLWHWHFGQGIVATPSDFGQLSGGPSHPELLDWLAIQFVEKGWSIKAIHRLIVMSRTYRQSSQPEDPETVAHLDPDNKLLSHVRTRRLDAEQIRDSVLAVSGRLSSEQFGLPIFPPLPGDIAETIKYGESKWDTQTGPESRKRSIYIYQQRTLTMPFMQAFDSLVCDESRPRRRSSVTPLQALAMYNGNLTNEEASFFAKRIRLEAGEDINAQITRAVQLAYCRRPTPVELEHLSRFMAEGQSREASLTALCRILYNANEFVYLD